MYRLVLIVFLIQFSMSTYAQPTAHSPRLLVHLLDYLAKDYSGAISDDGKVLSQLEYDEQVEFAKTAVSTNASMPETKNNPEIQEKVLLLQSHILQKAPPGKVTPLAREIQKQVIEVTKLDLSPQTWPDLELGAKLYAESCVACHGSAGAGDGPAGWNLDPKPANFQDPDYMRELAPFGAYNTIRLGVQGTGMAAYPHYSDQEVWALAFYVESLRYQKTQTAIPSAWEPENSEVLKKVASLSDRALLEILPGAPQEKEKILGALRTHSGKTQQVNYLALAKARLKDAEEAFMSGKFDLAKTYALQSYLEGIEPLEARIRASDPDAVVGIEEDMAHVRAAIESRKSPSEVKGAVQVATARVESLSKLIENQEISPWIAFGGAFAIILREGFEAVLIVLALLGVIRATGSKTAKNWVHAGWLGAIGLGVVAWIFSGWVMQLSGAGREMMEGVTSLLAVVVLLYVGFWLHRQTEIGRWKTFLEVKVKGILTSQNLFGLAAISFVAVFREALETVLFLRAIWTDAGPEAKTSLSIGVVSSFALVLGLSWAALKYSKRLPLSKLFAASSIMMLGLATILAGKASHALQEAGVLGVTTFPLKIRWELAGIYPTTETMISQVVTFALTLGLWHYGKRPSFVAVENR